MAKQVINTGTVANDGTGDTIRSAMTKTNANFTDIYSALGDGSTLNGITEGITNELAYYSDPNTLSRAGGLVFDRTTKRMRIDGTSGTGSTSSILTLADNDICSMSVFEYSDSSVNAPGILLVKHRGTSDEPTVPLSGDALGSYSVWSTTDGTAETSFAAGRLSWFATDATDSSGINSRFYLQTKVSGSVEVVMESTEDGKLRLGNAYDMPKVDGSSGQVLTTDGSGSVSWQTNVPVDLTAITTDIKPTTNGVKSVGDPTHQFKRVHANAFTGRKFSLDEYDYFYDLSSNLMTRGIVSNNGDINVYNQRSVNIESLVSADGLRLQSSDFKPVSASLDTSNSNSTTAGVTFTRAGNGYRIFMVGQQISGYYSTPTTGIHYSDDSGNTWSLVEDAALPTDASIWYTCAASSRNVFVASGPSGVAVYNATTDTWTYAAQSFHKVAVIRDDIIAGLRATDNDGTVWLCDLTNGTLNDWYDITPDEVTNLRNAEGYQPHQVNIRNLIASKPTNFSAGELIISVGTQDGSGYDTDSYLMYLYTLTSTLTQSNAASLKGLWAEDLVHHTGMIEGLGISQSGIGGTVCLAALVYDAYASNANGGYDSAAVYHKTVYSYAVDPDHYFSTPNSPYIWSASAVRTVWDEFTPPNFTNLVVSKDPAYTGSHIINFGMFWTIQSEEGPAQHMSSIYAVGTWDSGKCDPVYDVPNITMLKGCLSVDGAGGSVVMFTGIADNKDPADGEGYPQSYLRSSNGVHFTLYNSVARTPGTGVEWMDMYSMGSVRISEGVVEGKAGGMYVNTSTGDVQVSSLIDGGSFSVVTYTDAGAMTLNILADNGKTHIQTPVIYGSVPSSATATGVMGQIAYDANYMYVCIATDTWKRTPLTTW